MITNLDKKIITFNARLESRLADLTKQIGVDINSAQEKSLKKLADLEKKLNDEI
jgi:hypothetical protein